MARRCQIFLFSFESLEKINKLFTGIGSVRIVKNCDFVLKNAALGLRPRAAFSRPRSQFFTMRTSQPANNIYIHIYLLAKLQSSFNYTDNQTQTAAKKPEMTSSIYSLVRIWKIRHSGHECSFVWILWVVYFPVKHSCIIIIIISISVLLRYNIFENNQVIMATTRLLMTLACLFTAFTSKEWLVTNKISLIWASLTEFLYTLLLPTTKFWAILWQWK